MNKHSLNRAFRLVWSDSQQLWQVAPESAKGRGKSGRSQKVMAVVSVIAGLTASSVADAAAPPDHQLPTGGKVVAGQAQISQPNAATLNVQQSTQRAVINWDTFNLGQAAQINFQQSGASAATLNRVLDMNPSQIFGKISAPGQVFISNPNGVIFGQSARVDVGGLVATTHTISNDNFMAGKLQFERNGATGSVVNEGSLKAQLQGYIALLAPEVRNHGVIVAQAGTVALAAGELITLNFDGTMLAGITATPSMIASLVENRQAVLAEGGMIILSAKALNTLTGSIIQQDGTLDASSLVERGGKILLEGDSISLGVASRSLATGATGGGQVLVGGNWQGQGEISHATTVTAAPGSEINVSATQKGDGGTAVLWSNVNDARSKTEVGGTIRAEAGPQGGQGGQVETSGHVLNIAKNTLVSTKSPAGKVGLWLLDPYDMSIGDMASPNLSTMDLNMALSLGDVTVSTHNGRATNGETNPSIPGLGNINLQFQYSALDIPANRTLTLIADAGISSSSQQTPFSLTGAGNLVLNQAGNSTLYIILDGGGTVIKQGVGSLTLDPANQQPTVWNNIQVDEGKLTLKHNVFRGTVVNNATLELNGGNFGGMTGSGNLILSADTTTNVENFGMTGSLTLKEGVSGTTKFTVGYGSTLGSINFSQVVLEKNSQLEFNRSDDVGFSGAITGSGAVAQLGAGKLTLTGDIDLGTSGNLVVKAGSVALAGGSFVGNISLDPTAYLGSVNLIVDNAVDRTIAGVISGSGSLTKLGVGRLTLSGENTYNGITTISDGALRITHSKALGTALGRFNPNTNPYTSTFADKYSDASTKIAATGVLELAGDGMVIDEPITITGAGGKIVNVSGSNTLSNTLTLQANGVMESTAGNLRLSVAPGPIEMTNPNGTRDSIAPYMIEGANNNLEIKGAGNTTLEGLANLGTGTITKNGAGNLSITRKVSDPANAWHAKDAAYDLNLQEGSVDLYIDAQNTDPTWGTIQNNGALRIHAAQDQVLSFGDGILSGPGSMEKLGLGELRMSGSNASTGPIIISEGKATIEQYSNAFPTNKTWPWSFNGEIEVGANATLELSGSMTVASKLRGTGQILIPAGAQPTLTGDSPFTGTVKLTGSNDAKYAAGFDTTNAHDYIVCCQTPASRLNLGNGGTHGSLNAATIEVGNNAMLTLNRSDNYDFTAQLTQPTGASSALLEAKGSGKASINTSSDLSKFLFYLSSNEVQFGNGGAMTGSLPGTIFSNSGLDKRVTFNAANDVTLDGFGMVGATMVKAGAGTLTYNSHAIVDNLCISNCWVSDVNVEVQSGAFAVQNYGGLGTVANNGTFIFKGNGTFRGGMSGTGAVQVDANSTLTLASKLANTGATTLNAGATVELLGDSGGFAGNVTNNGVIRALPPNYNSGTIAVVAVIDGDVSGSGSIEVLNGAQLALTGNNTYTGGTTVRRDSNSTDAYASPGTALKATRLLIGNGGTRGTLTGPVTTTGTSTFIAYNRSDDQTWSQAINYNFEKRGPSQLTLSGDNSFTALQVSEGRLVLTGNNQYTGAAAPTDTSGKTTGKTVYLIQPWQDTANNTTGNGGTLVLGNGGSSGTLTGVDTYKGITPPNTGSNTGFGVVELRYSDDLTMSLPASAGVTTAKYGSNTLTLGRIGAGTRLEIREGLAKLNNSTEIAGGISQTQLVVAAGGAAEVEITGMQTGSSGSSSITPNAPISYTNLGTSSSNLIVSLTDAGTGLGGLGALRLRGGRFSLGRLNVTGTNVVDNQTTLGVGFGGLMMGTPAQAGTQAQPAVLTLNSGSYIGFGGIFSGGGLITKNGAGNLALSSNSINLSGTITLNEGEMTVGTPNAPATLPTTNASLLAANIVNKTKVTFYTWGPRTFSGNISGSGRVERNGTGSLNMTGAYTYDGITDIVIPGGVAVTNPLLTGGTPIAWSTLTATQIAALNSPQMAQLTANDAKALTSTQVGAMVTKQANWLSNDAIGALTTAQVGVMAKDTVIQLVDARTPALGAPQIAGIAVATFTALTDSQFGKFVGSQVAAFTVNQVKALTTARLKTMTAGQITGFTQTHLQTLTQTQFLAFSPDQFSNLTPAQLSWIKPTILAGLNNTQVQSIAPFKMKSLTAQQVAGLRTTQWATLSPAQIGALTQQQVPYITVDQLKVMTPAQLAAIGTAQYLKMTKTQLIVLTASQKGKLSTDQIDAINSILNGTTFKGKISDSSIIPLVKEQLSTITTAELQALTTDQIQQSPVDAITAFSASQLGVLSATQVGAFTLEHMGALPLELVKALTVTQLGGLSANQIAAFGTKQLVAMSSTQMSALTTTQKANLDANQLLAVSSVINNTAFTGTLTDGYAPAPAPAPTPEPTPTPTPTPAPAPAPQPTPSPAPAPAPQPTPSPAPAPAPQPTPSPAPAPAPQPTPSPAPAPAPQPTPSPAPAPAPLPTPSPAPAPAPQPTPSPAPAPAPQPTPSPAPAPAPSTQAVTQVMSTLPPITTQTINTTTTIIAPTSGINALPSISPTSVAPMTNTSTTALPGGSLSTTSFTSAPITSNAGSNLALPSASTGTLSTTSVSSTDTSSSSLASPTTPASDGTSAVTSDPNAAVTLDPNAVQTTSGN